jgi:hypothetical protein
MKAKDSGIRGFKANPARCVPGFQVVSKDPTAKLYLKIFFVNLKERSIKPVSASQ